MWKNGNIFVIVTAYMQSINSRERGLLQLKLDNLVAAGHGA